MSERLRFTTLRTSIFAALGLSIAGCGGGTRDATETEVPDADGGSRDAADTGAEPDAGPVACREPRAIPTSGGQPSGFVRCADGTIHRVEAVQFPPPQIAPGDCKGTETHRSCSTDSHCTHGLYGRCVSGIHYGTPGPDDPPGTPTKCSCVYSCTSDADCQSNEVCIPGGVVPGRSIPFCAQAACITDDDCESGECGLSIEDDNGCMTKVVTLGCRSREDTCRTDADCELPTDECIHAGDRFTCMGETCAIGRPLLIDGRARTASAQSRADWVGGELLPDVSTLAPELRERLARHWLDIAAMEHASVGSFARFSLQLLALGAPPDLLAETQRAALDEVEHARMAYGVASAYAGRKLGPGALDPTGIELTTNRAEVIRALVFEACVNETLGVAEALAMADSVRDAKLAEVHRRIARDEQRHAELAWRTLAWLLDDATREEVDEAERAFAEAIEAAKLDPNVAREPAPENGLLDSKSLGSLRRQALAQVVEPCASGLFGRLKMAA